MVVAGGMESPTPEETAHRVLATSSLVEKGKKKVDGPTPWAGFRTKGLYRTLRTRAFVLSFTALLLITLSSATLL